MNDVNRRNFTIKPVLYDKPSELIHHQTISAPSIHGRALEILLPNCVPGNRVLDIGCGSGYLTACFMRLLEVNTNERSLVVGIDLYNDLVELSKKNILKKHKEFLPYKYQGTNPNNNVKLLCGNGWKGYSQCGKYDVIHVGASSNKVPEELLNQLNKNGIMIIPIGNQYSVIKKNRHDEIYSENILDVRFVPLTNENDDDICIK